MCMRVRDTVFYYLDRAEDKDIAASTSSESHIQYEMDKLTQTQEYIRHAVDSFNENADPASPFDSSEANLVFAAVIKFDQEALNVQQVLSSSIVGGTDMYLMPFGCI
jgi:hypothetical protein